MVNDTDSKLMYITTLGENVTQEDLIGLEEGVFYQLYASKGWNGLSKTMVYGIYQVVRKNLLQNIHQESEGYANVRFPIFKTETLDELGEPLPLSDDKDALHVKVAVDENMMRYGEDHLLEFTKHVVKTVIDGAMDGFDKTQSSTSLANSVAGVLFDIDRDFESFGKTGILTESNAQYMKYEIEELLDYLGSSGNWLKNHFIQRVQREIRGKVTEELIKRYKDVAG